MSVLAAPKLKEKPAFRAISSGRTTLYAAGVLAIALALAGCIRVLQAGRLPEQGVMLTGAFFAALLAAVPAVYLVRNRHRAEPATAGLLFLATAATILLAMYLYWVSWYVAFPADFLIWSEGDFVNDIIKFSVGYPLYSPQVNNDSFHYVPGAQLLTYLLAWLAGKGNSIPAFRAIQVIYTAIAAFIATLCCRRILRMALPEGRIGDARLWNSFWYAAAFLMATNSIANPFVHNLHGDALAQLVAITAYYLLLKYGDDRRRGTLIAMVLLIPAAFMIRQSLLVLAGAFAVFLLFCGPPWKRLILFGAAVAALMALTLGICYAIWGGPFFYWNFYILGKHGVSPLRSFQHVLDIWPYLAAGLLGGLAMFRGRKFRILFAAWLAWLAIIGIEAYTSGIAWMLNHIGPGCLIGGVWFLAGLAAVWNRAIESQSDVLMMHRWLQAGALSAVAALFFSGLGVVRIPVQPIPGDAYRYVRDIEHAFQGQPANRVLLDAGSWVYLNGRVV
ncbi:MAG TPA: hypothetical protein VLW25_16605, partial [Bryobacteraceae bacterium]|nr:hypothetical protein [Bryobacteraceae bacterium]